MRRKEVLSSTRVKKINKQRKRIRRRRFYLFLTFIIVLFVGLSYLSRAGSLNIVDVKVNGNKVVEEEEILSVVNAQISGRYLWLFPKSNLLLVPRKSIKEDLFNTYTRLNEVDLNIVDQDLEVLVGEREAHYTWCGENLPQEGTESEEIKCYFTDELGFVFDEAPYFSENVYFRFYGPLQDGQDQNSPTPIGSDFMPESINQLVAFRDLIAQIGLAPSSLHKNENNEMEMYLTSESLPPQAPKIIFPIDANLQTLAENLQAAITVDPLRTNLEEKKNKLLYVDLRFGSKVYYKFEE